MVADFSFNLSAKSVDLPRHDKLSFRTELSALTAYGFHRLAETLEYYLHRHRRPGLFARPDVAPDRSPVDASGRGVGDVDRIPLIAARLGGHDDPTWSALATVGYQLNDRWSVRAGRRTRELSREVDGRDFQHPVRPDLRRRF